jgi:hypothetical protein
MKREDVDTGFNATLRRVKGACDVIEAGVPPAGDERFSLYEPYGGGYAKEFTLEEAVSEALELTGDEVRANGVLILVNRYQQIVALFHDGRAFIPNELLDFKGESS